MARTLPGPAAASAVPAQPTALLCPQFSWAPRSGACACHACSQQDSRLDQTACYALLLMVVGCVCLQIVLPPVLWAGGAPAPARCTKAASSTLNSDVCRRVSSTPQLPSACQCLALPWLSQPVRCAAVKRACRRGCWQHCHSLPSPVRTCHSATAALLPTSVLAPTHCCAQTHLS